MIAVLTVCGRRDRRAAGGRLGGRDGRFGAQPEAAAARATRIRRPRSSPRTGPRSATSTRTRCSNYVSPNQIPKRLKEATIAIEDRRFYQHGALDYQGILRAGVKDLLGAGQLAPGRLDADPAAGQPGVPAPRGTTSIATSSTRSSRPSWPSSSRAKHSKDWILNAYLNNVPYGTTNGEEAVGVGAAALMFFNKPVWKLNLAQMSLLAGLPQSPTQYNPTVDPKLAKARRNAVLQAMVESHYITPGPRRPRSRSSRSRSTRTRDSSSTASRTSSTTSSSS